MEINADKMLGFLEALISKANRSADEAKNEVALNLNIGAMLAYSKVIQYVKEEMKNGRGSEGACSGVYGSCEGNDKQMAEGHKGD